MQTVDGRLGFLVRAVFYESTTWKQINYIHIKFTKMSAVKLGYVTDKWILTNDIKAVEDPGKW